MSIQYIDPIEQYIDEKRLLGKPELQNLTGKSRATLARWVKDNKFPQPSLVQNGRSMWFFETYQLWLSQK
jgi:predicted DNA-binding transcriptional regulator AlpA